MSEGHNKLFDRDNQGYETNICGMIHVKFRWRFSIITWYYVKSVVTGNGLKCMWSEVLRLISMPIAFIPVLYYTV